ncbi:conserved hypothetical protein [Bradyrhizobium sp. ORS 278]|uniref:hypothetical protein n=1 Tax=Bradyrhizobium sp. (strain ORS 278) TaxID=114615 RepID=UPI0001507FEA|nr:hypothetical protein [Bradyrhizobium sp. ORS 278]CAL76761.1 conserved hypothetical protein [Bradyrhizobium sp. ORS 278]
MNPVTRDTRSYLDKTNVSPVKSSQPIALAAATLLVLVAGIGGIVLWRAYAGSPAEAERGAVTRQLQARTVQASEQLVEKTKGLEATQQESIDQLQMMQEQLQSMRRLLTAQQADTKRLSDQVSTLKDSIDGLRQSFASTQSAEQAAPSPRNRSIRERAHASRSGHRARRNRG